MWDLPGPGIKPMSHVMAGRFFTSEPPGKPLALLSNNVRLLKKKKKWLVHLTSQTTAQVPFLKSLTVPQDAATRSM